jgi:hypothetical protein
MYAYIKGRGPFANSARGYQSTSYLICMDIRYELGPFQNPSKISYGTIWASTLDMVYGSVHVYYIKYMAVVLNL